MFYRCALVAALLGAIAGCSSDECIRNSDCNDGLVCSTAGVCMIRVVDGGADDGGAADGGTIADAGADGGDSDAGVDAAPTDAGPDAAPTLDPSELSLDGDPPGSETTSSDEDRVTPTGSTLTHGSNETQGLF